MPWQSGMGTAEQHNGWTADKNFEMLSKVNNTYVNMYCMKKRPSRTIFAVQQTAEFLCVELKIPTEQDCKGGEEKEVYSSMQWINLSVPI